MADCSVAKLKKMFSSRRNNNDKRCGIIPLVYVHGSCKILLLKHNPSGNWGFPKGAKELVGDIRNNQTETDIDAAIREAQEEAGLHFTHNDLINVPRISTDKHIYFVVELDYIPKITIDNNEIIEYQWITPHNFDKINLKRSKQTMIAWRKLSDHLRVLHTFIPICPNKLSKKCLGKFDINTLTTTFWSTYVHPRDDAMACFPLSLYVDHTLTKTYRTNENVFVFVILKPEIASCKLSNFTWFDIHMLDNMNTRALVEKKEMASAI